MGRSRGGLTTKIHALVDAEGRPVRLELTAGQKRRVRERLGEGMSISPLAREYGGSRLMIQRARDRAKAPTEEAFNSG